MKDFFLKEMSNLSKVDDATQDDLCLHQLHIFFVAKLQNSRTELTLVAGKILLEFHLLDAKYFIFLFKLKTLIYYH